MGAAQLLDESDYQRLAELRYRLRGFLKFSEHEAAKIGLNPQQHQALLAIKGTREDTLRYHWHLGRTPRHPAQ
jgi:hypothetical protein